MRIALLTDGIHPYVIGGMQKHSYFLARELARKDHTVYLFHCNQSSYDANKLEFFSEEERSNIKPFLIPFPANKHFPLHYIAESYEYSKAIHEALKPHLKEVDFIFSQGFCAWHLLKHKTSSYPPVAVHFHGLEMFQHIPSVKARFSRYFLQRAVKANIRMADYTISFGGKLDAILQGITGKAEIWQIPGGIESSWHTDTVPAPTDKVRFAFIGRYERRKGLPELNSAINNIQDKTRFTVDFIGDIPNEQMLSGTNLCYHGKITSEAEIKDLLANCDVLLCPSYAEGMPTVIMEAMASGLAIIASDVGAVSKLVDSSNGWLIDSPAPGKIAAAMLSAIEDKSLQQKKNASLQKIKSSFLVEQVTALLIGKMQDAISKR